MISENVDVLTEILLLLPAKSLIRFKLVCKQWHSIISDPHFSRSHNLIHRHRTSHLLFHRPKSTHAYLLRHSHLLNFDFSPTLTSPPTICSVSNGLFLLRCDSLESPPSDCYYVYNPTTKQSRRITLRVNPDFPCATGLNIVFDSMKSTEYKIVCVRSARRRISSFCRTGWRRCQIEVFESKTGEWNVCGEDCLLPREMDFDRGVYWNDGVHWRGLFFDMKTYSIGVHPVIKARPDFGLDCVENYVEMNDSFLCVAHFRKENSVEVYELEKNYSKWSLKFGVSLGPIAGCLDQVAVLGIEWDESEEDCKIVVMKSGKVMTYGVREKVFEEVVGFKDGFYQGNCMQIDSRFVFQFLETLALFDS